MSFVLVGNVKYMNDWSKTPIAGGLLRVAPSRMMLEGCLSPNRRIMTATLQAFTGYVAFRHFCSTTVEHGRPHLQSCIDSNQDIRLKRASCSKYLEFKVSPKSSPITMSAQRIRGFDQGNDELRHHHSDQSIQSVGHRDV